MAKNKMGSSGQQPVEHLIKLQQRKARRHNGVQVSYLRLVVEVRQDGGQEVADEGGLVVRGRVEGDEGDAAHVEVVVRERLEEVADAVAQQAVDRLRLVRDGELHGCRVRDKFVQGYVE